MEKDLLRVIFCGAVDNGKSTLIGRLLLDFHKIPPDEFLLCVDANGEINAGLLLDGLKDERAKGITIDVAYRYFSTITHSFILADVPGHDEYTARMFAGASTAHVAVLVVDATIGLASQAMRHAQLLFLLGVRKVILAINKMDAVNYSQSLFEDITRAFRDFSEDRLSFDFLTFVPVSARYGDNIVSAISPSMSWYEGASLMACLEASCSKDERSLLPLRIIVQNVGQEGTGVYGHIMSGAAKKGAQILIMPSHDTSHIEKIFPAERSLLPDIEATFSGAGTAVRINLSPYSEISPDSILCQFDSPMLSSDNFLTDIVWFSSISAQIEKSYLIKINGIITSGTIVHIEYIVDRENIRKTSVNTIKMNDIALCQIAMKERVMFDLYEDNKETGRFIIIDPDTCDTLGAGVIRKTFSKNERFKI